MTIDEEFEADVVGFAGHLASSLLVLAGLAGRVETTTTERGALVELLSTDAAEPRRAATVTVKGQPAAGLTVRVGLRRDSSGQYLAVTVSSFALYALVQREPLFRLDYRDDMGAAPSCHWQVHAERGALSHLLTLAGSDKPHSLSALHIPVGGARMRPCIEDFLQFAIDECGIDAVPEYRSVLDQGRETWRRRQVSTCARDVPDEAARSLRELGYAVAEPATGAITAKAATLRHW